MRQHIVKVGWLLTHDRKAAFVFYAAVQLPGVLLRAILLWLGLRALRAESTSLITPSAENRRLVPPGYFAFKASNHPLKRSLVALLPAIVGALALWWIATSAVEMGAALDIAAAGDIDALNSAIAQLSGMPNFWLWMYLAFTLANCLLPPIPDQIFRRHVMAWLGGGLLVFSALLTSEAAHTIATALDSLLKALLLILTLASLINLALALVLGTMEAVIERVTGHNATYRDGTLETMKRPEAENRRVDSTRQSDHPRKNAPRSWLDLPLPIPGPPGVEPVSKRVAAVLHAPQAPKRQAKPPQPVVEVAPRQPPEGTMDAGLPDELIAPFARPFAPEAELPDESANEAISDDSESGFARPFAGPDMDTGESDGDHSVSRRRTGPASKT